MTKRSRKMRKNRAILEAKTTGDSLLRTMVLANIQMETYARSFSLFVAIALHLKSLVMVANLTSLEVGDSNLETEANGQCLHQENRLDNLFSQP